jgi:Spy/CpxP family protein refolding chaperone
MKKLIFLLLAALACSVPASTHAMDAHMAECKDCMTRKPGMGQTDRMGEMMGMCLANADKIGLSDEQSKKITPIHREMQKRMFRFNADLKIAEMDQMEIMEVKDFDLNKAIAAVRKVADLKTAHHVEMLKAMKEVRTTLTDEQFGKLKSIMHKDMPMGGEMPGMGMQHKH